MKKILFLDDEESILNTYRRMIRTQSFDGYFAKNSIEAQKIVDQFQIDLIVSDYRLQEETGLDFLKKIRVKNKDLPMIIISGYAEENFIRSAMETNVIQDYLIKPVNLALFQNILIKYL